MWGGEGVIRKKIYKAERGKAKIMKNKSRLIGTDLQEPLVALPKGKARMLWSPTDVNHSSQPSVQMSSSGGSHRGQA